MTKLQNESFIRSQIRRILLEEKEEPAEEKPKEEKPKRASHSNKVVGNVGRGDIPKAIKDALGGGGKATRLASSDPAQLMKNLKVSRPHGKDDEEKLESYIGSAISSTKEMSAVFSGPEKMTDSQGRTGFLVRVSELKPRDAHVFVYDAVRGAANAGYLDLDGIVRVDATSGGSLAYGVGKESERWNEKA